MPDAYAEAGVDVDVEAEASHIMYEAARATFENRTGKIGEIVIPSDDFSGLRYINVGGLPHGSAMNISLDGAGTKVEIAQRMGDCSTLAFDLFAMVCDDAVVRGAEPVLVGSVLDLKSLGTDDRFLPTIQQLAKGYVMAARAANVAVVNGEIAQMGPLVSGYGDFPYNWSATVVWFARREKLFTGKEICVGDSVVVLKERGFRANGYSLIRKVLGEAYGESWHHEIFEGMPLGLHVLFPSTIYSEAVVALHGGFGTEGSADIHGVVHFTGGGIPEKFARVLRPSGLGVMLTGLFSPCTAMVHCQEVGDISDFDAYRAWGMGQGMGIITPEPDKVIYGARRWGIDARTAGEIVAKPGVTLVSRGTERPGQELFFPPRV
jgi:phosphoribosylformylglycinamidine cyclo-ligase